MRPPNEAGTGSIHLVIARIANRIPGNEYQIPPGLDYTLPASHRLAELALDAIPHHCVTDPATD